MNRIALVLVFALIAVPVTVNAMGNTRGVDNQDTPVSSEAPETATDTVPAESTTETNPSDTGAAPDYNATDSGTMDGQNSTDSSSPADAGTAPSPQGGCGVGGESDMMNGTGTEPATEGTDPSSASPSGV